MKGWKQNVEESETKQKGKNIKTKRNARKAIAI